MFLINRGDIIERFDAIYYSASNTLKIVNDTIYLVKRLSEVAFLQRGKFSHRPRNDERFYNGVYPFIQTGDIVKASQNNDTITFTQTLNELGLSVSKLFQPNILIITIAANIGDTAILTYPACFPDSLVTITPKNAEVTVRYLNVYFKYVKDYLFNLAPQAAQKNINLQQLSPTPVVIPPLEIQDNIVSIFENAYTQKQQKEAKAAALLASIDGYLLQELGITLPPPSEKKTFFYTPANKVSGGRFDPYYHQSEFEELELALENGKYGIKSFKKLAKKITSGTTPTSGGDDYTSRDLGIPFIRSGEINEFDEINFEDVIYIKPSVHNKMLKSSQLKKNDLMIAIVGATIGQVGIFKYEFEANINQAIALIRFDNSVNVEFVKSFLKTTIGQKVLDKLKRPVARANINLEEISSIKIPLPPPEKQTEIANHISALRTQAKQLQQQAAAELEQAKQQVEQLILGNPNS